MTLDVLLLFQVPKYFYRVTVAIISSKGVRKRCSGVLESRASSLFSRDFKLRVLSSGWFYCCCHVCFMFFSWESSNFTIQYFFVSPWSSNCSLQIPVNFWRRLFVLRSIRYLPKLVVSCSLVITKSLISNNLTCIPLDLFHNIKTCLVGLIFTSRLPHFPHNPHGIDLSFPP